MERTVLVVHAGAEEVRQHIVAVGGADQLPNRQSHALCVVGRQDVAEVAGGHTEVHLVAHAELPVPDQVAVGGDIVDHLGQDAAPVDGVGGGQEVTPVRQGGPDGLIGENALYTSLGVVEVALHGADAHIGAVLSDHLGLLDLGHAVLGVEYQDLRLRHVGKALHRSLAGVAGSSHQDAYRLGLSGLAEGGGEQLGQHLQGHVLEGAGGAVPQLQAVGGLVHRADRGHGVTVELLRAVGVLRKSGQLLIGVVGQVQAHDLGSPLLVPDIHQALQKSPVDLRDLAGGQQAAVPAQAHLDGLRCVHADGGVPCAVILHVALSF